MLVKKHNKGLNSTIQEIFKTKCPLKFEFLNQFKKFTILTDLQCLGKRFQLKGLQ